MHWGTFAFENVPDSMKLFDFLLQQAIAIALKTVTYEVSTLEGFKIILSKAVDAYHSLCTAGKWHVKMDMQMLFAGTVRRKYVLFINVLNQKIKRR